ncbi:MAG: peptidylprolyl isomerase [Elusimicrobiota bacterium]
MNRTLMTAAVILTLLAGCAKKDGGKMIEAGSKIKMHYSLTVDGAVVDSSQGKAPLEFAQGSGMIIPGLDKELMGLQPGDKKKVTVAPKDGYGEHRPDGIQKVPKKNFADAGKLQVGAIVGSQVQGKGFQARIVEIGANDVTLDFNHPLAGKTLNFDIEIVAVEPPATS